MNYEERGFYMHLLCLQHQSGRIPAKAIKMLIGNERGDLWDAVKDKFRQDENGNFYNEFLEIQIQERLAYNEGRQKNATKKDAKPKDEKHMVEHMQHHMNNHKETISNTIPNSNSISIYNSNSSDSKSSISVNRGMQGGFENSPSPEFYQALYLRFMAAYGNLSGRPTKSFPVQAALTHAIRDYMENGATPEDAATYLCEAAKLQRAAYEKMIQSGGKASTVMNPENWLSEGCYRSNPTPETVEVLTSAQKRQKQDDEILRKVFDKMQKDKEAQNATR